MLKAHLHACVGGREAERGRVRGGESDKDRERQKVGVRKERERERKIAPATHTTLFRDRINVLYSYLYSCGRRTFYTAMIGVRSIQLSIQL